MIRTEKMIDMAQIKAVTQAASRDELADLLLSLCDISNEAIDRAVTALLLSRWLFVAQFALWCVWLA